LPRHRSSAYLPDAYNAAGTAGKKEEMRAPDDAARRFGDCPAARPAVILCRDAGTIGEKAVVRWQT
jgi:hypothetical protein